MVRVEEIQSTKTNGDTISGDLVFRITDAKIDDFLKYRAAIREITGFGKITFSQTLINEAAVITKNNLDRRPELYRETAPLPQDPEDPAADPAKRQPDKPEKGKNAPRLGKAVREYLKGLIGLDQGAILKQFRKKFKYKVYSDSDIIALYNRAHNIR